MGIFKAFDGALSGTFADQWRDIITVDTFDDTVAVMPGVNKGTNNGRGSNLYGSEGVITNGSKIYVPENTLAIVFDSSGIEGVISKSGGYEYRNGAKSVLSHDGIWDSIIGAIDQRFVFGGQPSSYKKIVFINLREIRNIHFGTHGPLLYHDLFYDTDLEIIAHGNFSLKITNPLTFIQNYLPANLDYYDFNDKDSTSQIITDIAQSLAVALNSLSGEYRISDLPAHTNEVSNIVISDSLNVGLWEEKYGFKLVSVSLRNIELTKDSRELVKHYSSNKMNVTAYDNVQKKSADIAFQQNIASGIKEHGLGDGAGVIMAMNMMQGVSSTMGTASNMSFEEQANNIKRFKELLDMGAISQEEFDTKKKEILGL